MLKPKKPVPRRSWPHRCKAAPPRAALPQEWWGITDLIKDMALKISKHGYRCLVPDLYKGKIGVDKEEAQHVSTARPPAGGGGLQGLGWA